MTIWEAIWAYTPPVVMFGGWLVVVIVLMVRKRWRVAVALGCIWLLALLIFIPSMKPGWPEAKRNTCQAYMRVIQEAKATWARENHKFQSDEPAEAELRKYIKHDGVLHCPSDNRGYRLGKVSEPPVCPNVEKRGHIWKPSK